MKIRKKITCFGCGYNFYVIVTDDDRTYIWGVDINKTYNRELLEVTNLSGKTIGNLFLFKVKFP